MPRCALVNASNEIVRVETNASTSAQTRVGFRWLECPAVSKPTFDSATEAVDGPTYTVNANDVTEVWTKRNLTAPEISAAKDAAVEAMNGTVYSALLKALLNHENRIRTLESKATITMAQFKTGLKALL